MAAARAARGRRGGRLHRPPGRAAGAATSTPAVYELFGDKAGLVRELFFEGFRMLAAPSRPARRADRRSARPRRRHRCIARLRRRPPGPRRGDVLPAVRRLRPGSRGGRGGPGRPGVHRRTGPATPSRRGDRRRRDRHRPRRASPSPRGWPPRRPPDGSGPRGHRSTAAGALAVTAPLDGLAPAPAGGGSAAVHERARRGEQLAGLEPGLQAGEDHRPAAVELVVRALAQLVVGDGQPAGVRRSARSPR